MGQSVLTLGSPMVLSTWLNLPFPVEGLGHYNTQATRCPALRLYVVHVVLSFFISLLLSVLQKPCYVFFFFLLHCIFQVLITFLELGGPNWLDTVAQNKELFPHYLTQPGLFFSFFLNCVDHNWKGTCIQKDKDLCLLPKKKDEQGSVQNTLARKRRLPLPMIKATIHPSIPETVLVSSYCLRIILHRAAFTF